MPWIPEMFSAPMLERLDRQAHTRAATPVPYFEGVRSGETDALLRSFAGEPEVHHPIRGRVKGRRAFVRFVAETNAWLTERNVVIEHVDHVITPRRGVEEVVLALDGEDGRIQLPVVVVADRDEDVRILELRVYYSTWPLTGRHANRPPLLQPDSGILESDVVGEHQRGLAAGDPRAVVATFEPDGYVRESAGAACVHRGHDELLALYEMFFSNGGGIPLEHCTVTDDGRACAVEYNVVSWGRTELLPGAGLAVYVRGSTGRLAGARIYDDIEPPLGSAR